MTPTPELSVVLVAWNMPRAITRTLRSLAPEHQRHLAADAYEVIVVDNGSTPPLELSDDVAPNVRLIRIDDATSSPAPAVNRGLAEARGSVVAMLIDGAHMASPGLLHTGLGATRLHPTAIVTALGYYLGADYPRFATRAGFGPAQEDALLEEVGWPQDGYRLFEVSTMSDSTVDGWFHAPSESNCLFLTRDVWGALGGVDEAFVQPGGGLVNLDLYERALALPGAEPVVLLGEATFHQIHGGAASGLSAQELLEGWAPWGEEYERLRGRAWTPPRFATPPTLVGPLPPAVLARFTRAALFPMRRTSLLGTDFDRVRWTDEPLAVPKDPIAAALVELVHEELAAERWTGAAAIARLARERFPAEPEPPRVLQLVGDWLQLEIAQPEHETELQLALGDAHRALGEHEAARRHYETALTRDEDLLRAHVGLSHLALPGEQYFAWLERIQAFLSPVAYLEIGVFEGNSLALAPPGTLAIGVDPAPRLLTPPRAEVQLFPQTSDAFFASGHLERLLAGAPLGLAFVDGLHVFEQALRDVLNVARFCGPRSLVVIHHTLPLNERTQRPACDTRFHTGDVWKLGPALRALMPELELLTIATPWSGLTLVKGFTGAAAAPSEAEVARLAALPYAAFAGEAREALHVVPNDWAAVEPWLAGLVAPAPAGPAPTTLQRVRRWRVEEQLPALARRARARLGRWR